MRSVDGNPSATSSVESGYATLSTAPAFFGDSVDMSASESSVVAREPELQSPRETETKVDAGRKSYTPGASDWQKEVDVEGGTTIFHYCEKMNAIFRSTGNRQKNYRQVEIPHRICPPKKMVPRSTLEITL